MSFWVHDGLLLNGYHFTLQSGKSELVPKIVLSLGFKSKYPVHLGDHT